MEVLYVFLSVLEGRNEEMADGRNRIDVGYLFIYDGS